MLDVTLKLSRTSWEYVHYFDETTKVSIRSKRNTMYINEGEDNCKIELPLSWFFKLFSFARIIRRVLRLDKANAHPVFFNGALFAVLFIYRGKVYYWDKRLLTPVLELEDGRNLMQQAICQSDEGDIVFSEYSGNRDRRPVPVYRSIDFGKTWSKVYEFSKYTIKHVHACQWDPFTKSYWLCTGDFDGECKIVNIDRNFSKIEVFGDGGQKWRACQIIFTDDYLYWGMDSQLEACRIVKFNRKTYSITLGQAIDGPAWYYKKLPNGHLLTTSVEPGISCVDDRVRLYYSNDLESWIELASFKKDFLPPRFFGFGSISFSNGNDTKASFYMNFDSIKENDAKAIYAIIN